MKLIALDLDGTLEDSRDDMVAAAARVRTQLDLPAREPAALRPFVNGGMDQLYRACFDDYLAGAGNDGIGLERVRVAYEADYLANVAIATRLYEGIAQALSELAKLGTLACITNKPERISRRLLDELGVGALFHTVVGGDSCTHAKPHPMMLQAAADSCGFDRARDQVFMIGDTAADMQLASSFGATGIWCAWGYVAQLDASAAQPTFAAQHPRELAVLVRTARGTVVVPSAEGRR
jgi:HAD superfamily hydrolase (TIGR01549 family)